MDLERVIELGVAAKTSQEEIAKIQAVLEDSTNFRGVTYDGKKFHGTWTAWFAGEKETELHKKTQSLVKELLLALIQAHELIIKTIEEELKQSQNS